MTHSATEVQALATRAARGAGFPPAQAELFGRACVQHLALDGDAAPLIDALANPADSPILRLPLLLDDVLAAAALTDPVELTLQNGDAALAPSYASLLPVAVLDTAIVRHLEQKRLRITLDLATPSRPVLPPRIKVPAQLLVALERLAKNTYVPATDASRRAGAGAGLNDND